MRREYDIVVIGGGHAGAEAAWAAARLGAHAALVTLSAEAIARMSCNPAIGGIGKGQIVREIDALGGLMGLAADATGIQFRMLNRSKGPAVWGPRCQSDRHAYAAWIQAALRTLPNLEIIEGEVIDLLTEVDGTGHRALGIGGLAKGENPAAVSAPSDNGASEDQAKAPVTPMPNAQCPMPRGRQRITGVKVLLANDAGELTLHARAVVITAGTFLRGWMHCGQEQWGGGRYGEPAARRLSAALERLGIRLGRLKTGTCPRIAAETIDTAALTRQDGDAPPAAFSFMHDALAVEQIPCWITFTNPAVHQIIRENLHRAPMHTGQITAGGPRYCPSLETKIERFADKTSHQVFLEPEGRDTNWVYLNGVSTSLPPDVQERIVRGLAGLERAAVLRWGYAIEYDYADPTGLLPSLECKAVAGLFLAGQVNGTTGYEEAAAQGLVAGLNAARGLAGREPLVLRRDQAYIGVMIDDLVTRGILEPYRMFTSRAEYRLMLRADNADRRLTPIGREAGLVDDGRWGRFSAKREAVERALRLLRAARHEGHTLAEWLARPGVTVEQLLPAGGGDFAELWQSQRQAVQTLAVDLRYAGYLAKEMEAASRFAELEARRIPAGLDYGQVPHLRAEARERLSAIAPATVGQALRVSGVTPADITVLMIHLSGR